MVEQATESSSGAARGHDGAASTRASKAGDDDFDIVAASEWPGVAAERVLLSPSQCRTLWRQFSSDSGLCRAAGAGPFSAPGIQMFCRFASLHVELCRTSKAIELHLQFWWNGDHVPGSLSVCP